jgi:N-methylhydantoinase A/oxoprolinase/acetone carboxylase beta subunit
MQPTRDFSFFIDRGGTFTDVVASVPDASAPGGVRFRVTKARRSAARRHSRLRVRCAAQSDAAAHRLALCMRTSCADTTPLSPRARG